MLFNSWQFLVFFPTVTLLYFALPHRFRWLLLLIASCIFYMAFIPAYILILLVTIIVDFTAGIFIAKSNGRRRKIFLIISIAANLGFLAFFKYYGFAASNLSALANFIHWNYTLPALKIILPIGLSFHTFQAMSYTIEVYRGRQAAEKHFGIYALYVMFYPQLVAGPIERPQNLIHQFYEEHNFDYARVVSGLKRMAWGLFKKIVIADRAAVLVDAVYNHPENARGISFIVATIIFSFQIYCDFSGYSDIAIGAARVMGFRLMENFNRPYFSKSIKEFWRRWHISLSTWFKDYLYIPLGGNRVGKARWLINIMVVFIFSGLWHGASWNFVIWGALHGFYQIVSYATAAGRAYLVRVTRLELWPGLLRLGQVTATFSLVTFAWIFFRARDLSESMFILKQIGLEIVGISWRGIVGTVWSREFLVNQGAAITLAAIVLLETVHLIQRRRSLGDWFVRQALPVRWAFYLALFWGVILFGKFGERQFIYFVF